MSDLLSRLRETRLTTRYGVTVGVQPNLIEVAGLDAKLGQYCEIRRCADKTGIAAEVVGLRPGRALLVPYSDVTGVAINARVIPAEKPPGVAVGAGLLGRVIDAFGHSLDGKGGVFCEQIRPLRSPCPEPMTRPPVRTLMETGVRAIDSLLTLGCGQRVGIFAGSGVGKSTLLGMICRRAQCDVNVIALIGERGREVREFIEHQLGDEGMRRSVVVVATAEQSAPTRIRAAWSAMAIAEYFRDQGNHVLLTMDSITRYAMAQREIGLAAGEPPTSRGYTPSVFSGIPELCERAGTSPDGAISAICTVLVEGDDFNEPVSDLLRATLDGHIVLDRKLGHIGHFPAIDVLQSASRVMGDITLPADRELARRMREHLGMWRRHQEMIEIGAYVAGSNPALDEVILRNEAVNRFLRQSAMEYAPRYLVQSQLAKIFSGENA